MFRDYGLHNIRIIMEKAHKASVSLYIAFIDYKKPYDSVKHAKLWTILKDMGMRETAVNALQTLYRDQQAVVRVDTELTDWFPFVCRPIQTQCFVLIICNTIRFLSFIAYHVYQLLCCSGHVIRVYHHG